VLPLSTICNCASSVRVVKALSKRAAPHTIAVGVTVVLPLQELSVVSSVVEEPETVLDTVYPPPFICRKIFTVVIPLGRVHEREMDLEPPLEVVETVRGVTANIPEPLE